jgi:Flp pilus assembly protein TadG
MVNAGLTKWVDLLRSGETLPQSLSAISQQPDICCRVGVSSMPSPAASSAAARGVFYRFRRNRRASAVVEFALVAPVFFALLFAIIETALMFFASQVLQTITSNSARQILTGQVQVAALSQAQFQSNVVCPQIPALFTCANIYIDVESYPTFSNVVINNQIDSGGNFINNMQYNPGGPSDIVVVRLFYQWPIFVTGLGYNIANLSGSKRLLVATAAFRNEPY